MKKNNKIKNKKKKDYSKILLRLLLVLLIIEIIFVPILYINQVKGILGIIFFLIGTTLLSLFILLLSRNCLKDYDKKKKKIMEKLNY